jgi:dTDP-4-dehydrorhamnose 3,5-epimerase-like enzyme
VRTLETKLDGAILAEPQVRGAMHEPDVGVDWQIAEPLLSGRDRSAPRLVEVADPLPEWG